ncbi:hypothetical protein [Hymenobacter sp. GOD-10R]|uniref:hypothetical protein n=1 Tax=Hymenobacter sp. GOD-10R TaxID=3093922 RepID=UPI002D782EFF|nr:hypothetical protein [Hymenobacter sp. GOD-10R]WRQ28142.1 hypothetical protein SD425_24050 [Hymenobacter sp. GOD-10R]
MNTPFSESDQPAYQILLYSHASPLQQQQAFTRTYQELQPRFPETELHQWEKAFARCEPTLWVEDEQVWVEDESLTRLLTYLMGTYTVAEQDRAQNGAFIHHLARKLNYISKASARGVEYWQAQPLADALAGQRALLLSFASEDVIALQVQEAFMLPSLNKAASPKVIVKTFITQEKTSTTTSPQNGLVLRAHWEHLQQWLEQQEQSLRPWNVAAIARQLRMSQSIVKRLLFKPQPYIGVGPEIFTRGRLSRAQRLFASYGYSPPVEPR